MGLISSRYLYFEANLFSHLPHLSQGVCVSHSFPLSNPPGSSVYGFLQARILSGLPFPSLGDLPDPGIEPTSPVLLADALPSEPPGKPLGQSPRELLILPQCLKRWAGGSTGWNQDCREKHQ